MSQTELTRLDAMKQLEAKSATQTEVAECLGLSVRQVKRLWHDYRQDGPQALLSKRRGRASNHQLSATTKASALKLIQKHYGDFGPTLAHEKLCEVHHLQISLESVRQLMIVAGLWRAKRARNFVAHQLRERRERFGELVQIDGSPHAWFEERAPRCTLLVFIDDATGRLNHLQFVPAETTWAYMNATRDYVQAHGRPLAFYSDKHSVFRVHDVQGVGESKGGDAVTQYSRALAELDIQIICANTPQAKGRVERANLTLQDRLVKELRLQGISDMEAANRFLPGYMDGLNARLAREPRSPQDAHRPLPPQINLESVFSIVDDRVLSKNLTLQYDKVIYQIQTKRPHYALRGQHVVVREAQNGVITIQYKGKPLAYTIFHQQSPQAKIVSAKEVVAMELAPQTTTGKRPPLKNGLRQNGLRPPSLALIIREKNQPLVDCPTNPSTTG